MLSIEKGTISFNLDDLKRIIALVDVAATGYREFSTEPMPDSDMSIDRFREELRKRGIFFVATRGKGLTFKINARNAEESHGYRIVWKKDDDS